MGDQDLQEEQVNKGQLKFDEFTMRILKWGSIILAIFAIAVGVISLFFDTILGDEPDKAVIWFGLAIAAILIPFIREITIKDMKLVLRDLKEAKVSLDATTLTSQQLKSKLTPTRNELISVYQTYLSSLPEEEKEEKVKEMSFLYIEEMCLDVKKVKNWLKELNYFDGKLDRNLSTEYIKSVRNFQMKNGLGNDGIFGYRTYDKIIDELKRNIKKS